MAWEESIHELVMCEDYVLYWCEVGSSKVLIWPLSCLHITSNLSCSLTGMLWRNWFVVLCYVLTDLRCMTTIFVPFKSYKSMVGDMLASKLLSSGDIMPSWVILNKCTYYPSYGIPSRHYPKFDVFYRIGRNTLPTTTSFANKFFSSILKQRTCLQL